MKREIQPKAGPTVSGPTAREVSASGRTARAVYDRLRAHPGRGGCGVGAVADLGGPTREVVELALSGLGRMEHRGGALDDTGDGAGLLLGTPRAFFEGHLPQGRHLRPSDPLAVGVFFLPPGEEPNVRPLQLEIDAVCRRKGLAPLGWRKVPVEEAVLGVAARRSHKDVWQLILSDGMVPRGELHLALFQVKEALERQFRDLYVASLAPDTVVYKAMATGSQLARYYPDLADPQLVSQVAVFHRRYSTNTFSNWYLAQPFRLIAHNGEFNTIKAVRGAVRNLEAELRLPGLLMHQGSDSADLDRMLEVLGARGVPLLEGLARMLPGAWSDRPGTPEAVVNWQAAVRRAMGPLAAWEGPAAVLATDGRQLVGVLDRMGLRPLRWLVTRDRKVVLASEVGAVPLDPETIEEAGQLEPGETFAVDLVEGRILRPDDAALEVVARSRLNHAELHEARPVPLPRAPGPGPSEAPAPELTRFGWTTERLEAARYMAREGKEPLSSMGFDRPLAVLAASRPILTKYFRQIIAVVTNPPIDPIREGGVLDLSVHLGPAPRISEDLPAYAAKPQYVVEGPVLGRPAVETLLAGGEGRPQASVVDATYAPPEPGEPGGRAIAARIRKLARRTVRMVRRKEAQVLVVSDRRATLEQGGRLPLPAVLAVSALHEALIDAGLRRRASIVLETAEVQEPHDLAVHLANGADAVHPWLFLEVCRSAPRVDGDGAENGARALETGLARILSKMGITTLEGYRGSRLFEALGVSQAVIEHYLPGVASRIGGIDLEDLHDDAAHRAQVAAEAGAVPRAREGQVYRKEVWSALQRVGRGEAEAWAQAVGLVEATPPVYLRDLLRLRTPARDEEEAPLEVAETAPPEWIVTTTFRGAAMSHGAMHRTAHRAIAAAFNRFGARSNSGEGGEDRRRDRDGDWSRDRSRIRQVASGRFGVDARYLVNADELEIKIGQGAKPGEGGHLPGHKVTVEIAAIRRTLPGVALISPPPHHDIYSIEDLAQLVYDLRQLSPRASLGVKVPSVTDLGTIAVGVVKAGADVITVSGAEGGTGAAAASSIEHAGLPLERGLAEVHQALVINGVRRDVTLRADGGIKIGADVVKLMALGADEVALGTALMIAEQCVLCHGCAKGSCPAGITTQDEVVAERLMRPKGAAARAVVRSAGAQAAARAVAGAAGSLAVAPDPEADAERRYLEATQAVERYLLALAGDVRRHLARLGLRSPRELVGRVDLLEQVPTGDPRVDKIDLSELLVDARAFETGRLAPGASGSSCGLPGDRTSPSAANARLMEAVDEALQAAGAGARIGPVEVRLEVSSCDRAVGATLAGAVASGRRTLPPGGLRLQLRGTAGQALGFGLVDGVEIALHGRANDSVGEAMSGGRLVVRRPPFGAEPRDAGAGGRGASAAGNAVGYGMTGGRLYVGGRCGQRLGVRMSDGAIVCEGAGKYAFEYMTGGVGLVLGALGGQACSGMTGGTVYLYDAAGDARSRVHASLSPCPLKAEDTAALRGLLEDFARATGSAVAERLLSSFEAEGERFLKVAPGCEGHDAGGVVPLHSS